MNEDKDCCRRCEKEFTDDNYSVSKDSEICLDCYTSEIDAAYDAARDAE